MLTKFNNLPIRHKLSVIVLLTSGLLIGFMATAVTIEKYISFRSKIAEDLSTLSQVVATNCMAALAFNDKATAQETLAALQAEKHVKTAVIFNHDKEVFATYANTLFFPDSQEQGTLLSAIEAIYSNLSTARYKKFSQESFELSHPIELNGKIIGYIGIGADLQSLNTQLQIFILIITLFSLILFSLGLFICSRLNRSIVVPLSDLASTMKLITQGQNYSIRVTKKQDDEIGVLIDGFNEMLVQIQHRDHEIDQQRNLLAQLVDERTQELKDTNLQLLLEIEERKEVQNKLAHAQKMEAIGTLAGGVAHDLNNILSGVVSYPDLLLMSLDENSSMRKPLQTIKASGKKAAAIVQDLLTLARRGIKIEKIVLLNTLIKEYLESPECTDLLQIHSTIDIDYSPAPQEISILGSSVHLAKTLMNLVTNAAEAMPDGGLLSISLTKVFLDTQPSGFNAWKKGKYAKMTVRDTGLGIPKQYINRIFEPFYSRKVIGRSGTGLGMAVVWGTVDDHCGYISVESEEAIGTCIDIYLPITDSPPQKTTADTKITLKWGNGENLLVVDDQEDQREIATELLKHLGYKVNSVSSGEAAILYLREHNVALVILDMLMQPGMDGLETYKQILAIRKEQRVIIASGYAKANRIQETKALGVLDYVIKPYTLSKLSRAVYRALHIAM